MTPDRFSEALREQLRAGAPVITLAPIPKNRRPFYRRVVEDFERLGYCHSPSGLTASIVMMYLRERGESFLLEWHDEERCYLLQRRKPLPETVD